VELETETGAGRTTGELGELGGRVQERLAAPGHDALLDGGTGGVERVDDAVLDLVDLHLGRAADLDDDDADRQLCEALLELLLLVPAERASRKEELVGGRCGQRGKREGRAGQRGPGTADIAAEVDQLRHGAPNTHRGSLSPGKY